MISLITVRFEIEEGHSIPCDLVYTGPTWKMEKRCSSNTGEKMKETGDHDIVSGRDTASNNSGKVTENKHDVRQNQEAAIVNRGRRLPRQIQIDTIKSTDNTEERVSTGSSGGAAAASADAKSGDTSDESSLRATIPFFSGNPTVEITKGIIHLYKDNEMTSLKENVPRSEMLCMLAVPATFSCNDLLQFTAPYGPNIKHVKIIKDSTPNEYMVLIKFRNQTTADEFYKLYNGRAYHSLEDKKCHLVYVSRLDVTLPSEGAGFPIPGLTELPNCPVCLERMDESVDGILTILCNHTFHTQCLSQWGDSSCPVCRYCQSPEVETGSVCFECDAQNDLWICMICGNIGCGRYSAGHAYSHFQSTEHAYAMELDNQRVWDYTGDNYVHRLVQNKSDGKPVAISNNDVFADEEDKRDALALEFTYLLTQQLDSQRRYYESKLLMMEAEATKKLSLREEELQRSRKAVDMYEKELADINQLKQSLESKNSMLTSKVKKISKQLEDEIEMNRCMRDNQTKILERMRSNEVSCKTKEDEYNKTVDDLKSQLRDLMIYLDVQNQISQSSEQEIKDIQGGSVTVGATANPENVEGKTIRKSRKKKK